MKKRIYFTGALLIAALIPIGCSNDQDTINENSEKKEVVSSVDIATLYYSSTKGKYFKDNDSTELFTGAAEEKNSSDQVIRVATFKNGYLLTNKTWEDFDGKLIQTEDMEYKDGKWYTGWQSEIYNNDEISLVREYYSYKNGRSEENKSWSISNNEFENYVSQLWINGDVVCSGGYYPNPKSYPKTKAFLECCESKKLKNFKYKIY